jgi:hypothetical protein
MSEKEVQGNKIFLLNKFCHTDKKNFFSTKYDVCNVLESHLLVIFFN